MKNYLCLLLLVIAQPGFTVYGSESAVRGLFITAMERGNDLGARYCFQKLAQLIPDLTDSQLPEYGNYISKHKLIDYAVRSPSACSIKLLLPYARGPFEMREAVLSRARPAVKVEIIKALAAAGAPLDSFVDTTDWRSYDIYFDASGRRYYSSKHIGYKKSLLVDALQQPESEELVACLIALKAPLNGSQDTQKKDCIKTYPSLESYPLHWALERAKGGGDLDSVRVLLRAGAQFDRHFLTHSVLHDRYDYKGRCERTYSDESAPLLSLVLSHPYAGRIADICREVCQNEPNHPNMQLVVHYEQQLKNQETDKKTREENERQQADLLEQQLREQREKEERARIRRAMYDGLKGAIMQRNSVRLEGLLSQDGAIELLAQRPPLDPRLGMTLEEYAQQDFPLPQTCGFCPCGRDQRLQNWASKKRDIIEILNRSTQDRTSKVPTDSVARESSEDRESTQTLLSPGYSDVRESKGV